jgi:hypothetical protein
MSIAFRGSANPRPPDDAPAPALFSEDDSFFESVHGLVHVADPWLARRWPVLVPLSPRIL